VSRILLIDDNLMIHRLILRLLEGDDVVVRDSAQEALAGLRAGQQFDVILCDLNMPEMNGLEFHRELTSMDPESAARALFLTGGPLDDASTLFAQQQAGRILRKPLDVKRLREAIAAVVSAS
jgi:two-component system, NtrC family, sensor kinase